MSICHSLIWIRPGLIGVEMALVSLNLKPSEKQLKDFAFVALIMFNLVGLVLFSLDKISGHAYWAFAIVGILIYALGRISIKLIKPIFLLITILTFPIGWFVNHLVMALFYYGIISGVGLIFRVLKRDPLCRKFDSNTDTYWIPATKERPAKDYFRQF